MAREIQDVIDSSAPQVNWRAYLELCKPRVVLLMLLTAIVGMCLAAPGKVPLEALVFGTLGIGFAAGSAAVINHLIDRKIDILMGRTERRPIPTGKITPMQAIVFAAVLGVLGLFMLVVYVNVLTAVLTFVTLLGYAVVYTVFLKHATSQNIVIGGLAGAMPPLLGWTAVTNTVDPYSFMLVLIIFIWTPPHFWALSIHRFKDYAKAKVPMLPVTHGIEHTKLQILLYTVLLGVTSVLPYLIGMSGLIYLVGALGLEAVFFYYSLRLYLEKEPSLTAFKTFLFSIYYLMGLFVLILVDHYIRFSVH
jgi:protoheme IX farnesyltransferase